MFRISFTQTALDYILEQQDLVKDAKELNQLVVAIFAFSSST
ncbi:MAG: hypothetical protein ACFFAS_03995 [Promethearchaeota archaeon]